MKTWHRLLCAGAALWAVDSARCNNDNNGGQNPNADQQASGGDRYEDSLLDLIKYVDENYRTLPAADVVAR